VVLTLDAVVVDEIGDVVDRAVRRGDRTECRGVLVELQGVEVLPAAVDHVDTREAGPTDLLAVAEVDLVDLRRGDRAEDLLREAGIVRAREVRAVRPALRRRGAAV